MQLKDLKIAVYKENEIEYVLLSARDGRFKAVYGDLELTIEADVKSLEEPIEILDGKKAILNGREYAVKVASDYVVVGPIKLKVV